MVGYTPTMAESDASSEMSEDALQKLVSRLVEAGGDLEKDDHAETPSVGKRSGQGDNNETDSAESEGSMELLDVETGQRSWPTSPTNQPRRSPRMDGLEAEAALLASAEASDVSSDGGKMEPMVVTTNAEDEIEADSCGYEGDVGESTKLAHALRRPSSLVLITPQGIAAKDGAEEADDEGSGKEVAKLHGRQQMASLDMSAGRGTPRLARPDYFGRMAGESRESPWEVLNETLREQGFHEVSLSRPGGSLVVPDLMGLADTLRDVLFHHRERGKIIQDLTLEISRHNQVAGHRDQVLNDSFRRQRTDLSKRSAGAEARVTELQKEKERLQEQLAKETRRLKIENANLASQLKQSEHRVKAKEVAAQGLMEKLRDEVEKERRSQQRHGEVLKKLQQREGRPRRLDDSRVSEALSAEGKARERAEAEMDSLRAEVARLGEELREKENTILRHRVGPDWTPDVQDVHSDELQQLRDRLAESDRSLRILRQREARAQERCANIQQERDDIQAKMDSTQESLANAQMELSSRPSLRNWRTSQRRIQGLEKKVAQASTQAKEAVDAAELRRWVDTRELMRRDRENHRLKLDRLDELPTNVMKQVLQDGCRTLGLEDVSLLGPSVEKLTKVVQVLPRLERFVNSVCGFVFRHSREVLSAPTDSSLSQVLNGKARTMEDVLPLLELWVARAQEPAKLKDFRRGILRALETRADHSQSQGAGSSYAKSDRVVISTIQHLVELERRSLEEVHLNQQADSSLHDDPELPVNRVVRHFQLLFGVKSIAGCVHKLNEIYRFSVATQTFVRTAADLLEMQGATGEAVMKRLEGLLQRRRDVDPEACLRVSHGAESWAAGPSPEGHSL